MRLWLRNLRESKGWSQADVAAMLEITRQSYNFYENGKRQKDMTISIGSKIADLFNIPLSTIRNFEEALADDGEEVK